MFYNVFSSEFWLCAPLERASSTCIGTCVLIERPMCNACDEIIPVLKIPSYVIIQCPVHVKLC